MSPPHPILLVADNPDDEARMIRALRWGQIPNVIQLRMMGKPR
ncbi:MAG: hypothetical protein AAGE59_12875 [Cyanobacteria bacterium P01_F01_bin.86]